MKFNPRNGLSFSSLPSSILIYGDYTLNKNAKLRQIIKENSSLGGLTIKDIDAAEITNGSINLMSLLSTTDMFQGPQLVVIRHATDKICQELTDDLFEHATFFIVVSDSYLGPSAKLRQLYEKNEQLLAVPCYDLTVAEISHASNTYFKAHQKSINPNLLKQLSLFLIESPHTIESELKKIITATKDEGEITTEAVKGILSSTKSEDVKEFVEAYLNKDFKSIKQLMGTDASSLIALLRTLCGALLKLHSLKCYLDEGMSFEAACKALRPPPFFKEKDLLKNQITLWHSDDLGAAIEKTKTLEIDIKKNALGSLEKVAVQLSAILNQEAFSTIRL